MVTPLFVVFLVLFLAYTFSEIAHYLKIPKVVGQIFVGFILGLPFIKSYLFSADTSAIFSFISEIAMILIFYFVGMETNIEVFRKNLKKTSLIAALNTTLPLVFGFLVSKYFFGFESLVSIIIGISLSVSSLDITLDVLEELKLLKSKIGNLIIAAAAVDDIFEFLLLSFILVSFHAIIAHTSHLTLIIGILLFVLVIIIFGSIIIPSVLRFFEIEKNSAQLFTGGLVIVFSMAYLADSLGIGSLIGALVAGILVRHVIFSREKRPWEEHDIARSIYLISFGFFVPIFFVLVGVNTMITSVPDNINLILILLGIGIIGTLVGTIIGVILGGGTKSEGLIVGFGVLPKGDVELAIASIALETGIIDLGIYSTIVVVAVLTTLFAPIIFELLLKQKSAKATHH